MNAENFLESKGIKLQNCSFVAYVENAMRQPDLVALMEEYANLKLVETRYFMEKIDKQLKNNL